MSLDFTISKFRILCSAIAENYPTLTLAEYFQGAALPERFAMMRHDIDRKPENALFTARIEAESGIRATYYFRRYGSAFSPEIMRKIEGMGHEVGYHYEVLGKAKGDHERAIEMFESELGEFREICDVRTISMHGNPLSKYDDRELWKSHDFRDFGVIGEAYLSAGPDVKYFSDTGRNWNWKNNMRDLMPANQDANMLESTDDLTKLIKSREINRPYVLTHPERWGKNSVDWGMNYLNDLACNVGKKVLVAVR